MFAVIGLGNPGSKYEATRHNAGFWVVDILQQRLASADSWKTKGGCQFIKTRIASEELLLVKPQKFMNLSGQAAWPLLQFFKVSPDSVVVVYDDLDLPSGRIQVRRGGSAAGHNGVSDMISALGTKDFYRIRVGVSGAQDDRGQRSGKDWVLSAPRPEEQELLDKAVSVGADALEILVVEGLEPAQRQCNRRLT